MNQLPTGIVDKVPAGKMTSAELHLLAECASVNCLMAGDASDIVVSWSKSVSDGFFFFEDELVGFERAVAAGRRWHWVGNAFIRGRTSRPEIVKKVVSVSVH